MYLKNLIVIEDIKNMPDIEKLQYTIGRFVKPYIIII